jgi:imidazolonepropionase
MMNLLLKNIKSIYRHQSSDKTKPSIRIEDGIIQTIAPFDEIKKKIAADELKKTETIDCSDCIALPGFVDSHTHLLFYGSRENELTMRAAGKPYLDILKAGGGIHSTVSAVRSASEEELIRNGLKFLDKALRVGTTTVEIKSGYGLDYENEKKMLRVIRKLNNIHPVDIIPTFLVHTVPKDVDRKTYIDEVAERMIPEFREYADWFDIFLEEDVFDLKEGEFLIKKAIDAGYYIGIHTNQIHDIGGVRMADELGVRHVDHLEVLTDEDARRIIDNENLYPVFLPTAEACVFSNHIGQIHKLLNIPDRIVLSTDFNPGSSPVLSPLIAMVFAILRYRLSLPERQGRY